MLITLVLVTSVHMPALFWIKNIDGQSTRFVNIVLMDVENPTGETGDSSGHDWKNRNGLLGHIGLMLESELAVYFVDRYVLMLFIGIWGDKVVIFKWNRSSHGHYVVVGGFRVQG